MILEMQGRKAEAYNLTPRPLPPLTKSKRKQLDLFVNQHLSPEIAIMDPGLVERFLKDLSGEICTLSNHYCLKELEKSRPFRSGK